MNVIPIAAAMLLMFQGAAAPKPPAAKATKAASAPAKAAAAKPAATDVGVTVAYKGKGVVDAGHKIIVFAMTDSNVTSNSRPIGTQFATKNGETVTFKNVASPIYVFAVYDEKGTYDGVSGPPPRRHSRRRSIARSPKGPATAVAPGSPAVKFTFDGSDRRSRPPAHRAAARRPSTRASVCRFTKAPSAIAASTSSDSEAANTISNSRCVRLEKSAASRNAPRNTASRIAPDRIAIR